MLTFKRTSAFFLEILIVLHCILIPVFAAEAIQNQENIPYVENVDPDTVLIYSVLNGNLYFGHYTYETADDRSGIIHLIASDTSITEAVIPATINGLSVTSIDSHAFDGCSNLQKVVIPKSVVTIPDGCLSDCVGLTDIVVEEGNPCYFSYKGALYCNSVMIGDIMWPFSALIRYPASQRKTHFDILDGIQYVNFYCFRGADNLTSVYIPSSVKSIEFGAFEDCHNLREIFYEGSSSQWEEIYLVCRDDSFLCSEIHYNAVSALEKLLSDTFVVVALAISVLLVVGTTWLIMRKSIQERKRYLQYRRNIENHIHQTNRSVFTFSDTTAYQKHIRPSSVLFSGLVVLPIIACIIDVVIVISSGKGYFDINRTATWKTILGKMFGPLRGGIILLVLFAISVCMVSFYRKKLAKKRNKISMRVRIIKSKSEAAK